MSKLISLIINVFKGMSSFIAAEKLPSAVFQVIENMELTQQFGNLKKRRGYKNILTSGLTSLAGMFEFKDLNGGRQILIQDQTALEESVYSSGYGAIAAITNDKRTAGSTVSQMYPVEYNRALRSPAGVGSDNYRPFWYGHQAARSRIENSYSGLTAGKYLCNAHGVTSMITWTMEAVDNYITDEGLELGTYILYASYVLDGFQKTVPVKVSTVTIDAISQSLKINLYIINGYRDANPRVTSVHLFMARATYGYSGDLLNFPAYWFAEVDLNTNARIYARVSGQFENTNPPTYVQFTDDFATFESLDFGLLYFEFSNGGTDYSYQLQARDLTATPKVRYSFYGTLEASFQNDAVTGNIVSRWKQESLGARLYLFYDNYYVRPGSEMYAYLNIPAGDTGLTDYKHKYGTIANNRYFAFGFTDGFAYYTPPYAPDVLCSQNIIRPKKDVVGCVTLGRDVIMFYKEGGSRVTVYSNAQIDQDDDFLNAGCVGMKSIVRLSDNEVVFMGYDGPYLITGRSVQYIGAAIRPWFVITGSLPYLTDAQKEACVAGYNHLKQLIFFSFPTYTTSPYTTGLVFVFDIRAAKLGFEPWWILKTDIPLYSFALADDLHLLAGSTTKIVDFNTQATPDETVSTRILLGMVRNESFAHRHKIMWHKLYVDYTGSDTITLNVYFDKSETPVVLTALNANKETMIGYIKQFFELELTTSASANDLEYSQIEFKALPRNY